VILLNADKLDGIRRSPHTKHEADSKKSESELDVPSINENFCNKPKNPNRNDKPNKMSAEQVPKQNCNSDNESFF
jgi:hypothetical protein